MQQICAQFSSCLVLTPEFFGEARFLTPAAVRKTQESGGIELIFWYTNENHFNHPSISQCRILVQKQS